MARRVLESLRGVGEVFAGDVPLRSTQYDLALWIDDEPGGPGSTAAPAATGVDGHIDIAGIGEAVVLAGSTELTLHLQDGRRLLFILTGTGGGIVGRGWLPES
jgi:hypothetical protein